MTPEDLEREKRALLAEIDAAFAEVDRAGGISWSESRVLDDYGSPEEQVEARRSDKVRHWRDLAENPQWNPEPGSGGFSFLDDIGFRYYLPAAMKRCIAHGHDVGLRFHLTIEAVGLDTWKIEKWSILDEPQRRCVASFVEYMIEQSRTLEWSDLAVEWWTQTRDGYWHQYGSKPGKAW
jgi:hypothetical protein